MPTPFIDSTLADHAPTVRQPSTTAVATRRLDPWEMFEPTMLIEMRTGFVHRQHAEPHRRTRTGTLSIETPHVDPRQSPPRNHHTTDCTRKQVQRRRCRYAPRIGSIAARFPDERDQDQAVREHSSSCEAATTEVTDRTAR